MLQRHCTLSAFGQWVLCGLVLVFSLFAAVPAQAQDELASIRNLWRQRKYQQVLPLLQNYREKHEYGREAEVDYMIATSLCRLPDLKAEAQRCFHWILQHYQLDKRSADLVRNELQACMPEQKPVEFVTTAMTRSSGGRLARVSGKSFFRQEDKILTSDPVKVLRNIPAEEFTSRLFKPEAREEAVARVTRLAGDNFSVISTGDFVLASASKHSREQLKAIAQRLEAYVTFFAAEYRMPAPSSLITVYMVPEDKSMKRLAESLHGIGIPEQTIGYSFRDDLSIVAQIQGQRIGTLEHELFHLMVRANFGDVPPWMDEGMAALYEVSETEQGRIVGLPNWRGPILRGQWNKRPSLRRLVTMVWPDFDNAARPEMTSPAAAQSANAEAPANEGGGEATSQAVNHALARYFALYLQSIGKLTNVYQAFQARKPEQVQADPGVDAVQLLETVLEKSLNSAEEDFVRWFKEMKTLPGE